MPTPAEKAETATARANAVLDDLRDLVAITHDLLKGGDVESQNALASNEHVVEQLVSALYRGLVLSDVARTARFEAKEVSA